MHAVVLAAHRHMDLARRHTVHDGPLGVGLRHTVQQIQRIHHIGQIGHILAETGRQIREQNLSDWYSRQAIYDRLATDRSRSIRGVDAFFDPHREQVVELPSGYGHAWANNLGEYILTEDSTFDPNLSSTLHWEPMQQQ